MEKVVIRWKEFLHGKDASPPSPLRADASESNNCAHKLKRITQAVAKILYREKVDGLKLMSLSNEKYPEESILITIEGSWQANSEAVQILFTV